mmetsp:Transcript_22352/g.52828  ORF Transcript_22352/g.52828 Transcript_22352/m.52828 type:complete len:418 (-) Transcript_22352:1616-2869(-)
MRLDRQLQSSLTAAMSRHVRKQVFFLSSHVPTVAGSTTTQLPTPRGSPFSAGSCECSCVSKPSLGDAGSEPRAGSALDALGCDLEGILAQAFGAEHTLQLGLHQRLPPLVEAPERGEAAHHARRNLGVELVDLLDAIRQPLVPAPVLGVEVLKVFCEGADDRAALVGVLDVEVGVREEFIDALQCVICVRQRLEREPLAKHEVVALGLLVEVLDPLVSRRGAEAREAVGGCDEVGHAARALSLLQAQLCRLLVLERRQVLQTRVLDAAHADGLGVVAEGLLGQHIRVVDLAQLLLQRTRQRLPQELVRRHQGVDVDNVELLGERLEAREREGHGLERLLDVLAGEREAHGLDQCVRQPHLVPGLERGDVGENGAREERLAGLPAVEAVVVVPHQERELLLAAVELQLHRRAVPAQHR